MLLLLALPTITQAADVRQAKQNTSVERYQLKEQLADVPVRQRRQASGPAGAFVGSHAGVLFVAGGVSGSYTDGIRIATRDAGSDRNGDDEITADERRLSWRDTELTLPGKRAFGASASHELGVLAIGGTDGETGYGDVFLIRWDAARERAGLLSLPAMPGISVHGGAAVIGDQLYVVSGDDGNGAGTDLYRFDLSRIQTDAAGVPLADGRVVRMTEKLDEHGRPIDPWQKLPSLPKTNGEQSARTHMLVVVQNDGRGDRLYVIGGRQNARHLFSDTWAYDPDAEDPAEAWSRKADIPIDGRTINGRTTGVTKAAGIALGQSHILVLPDGDGKNGNRALSYNTITDAWAEYDHVPTTHDPPLAPETEAGAGTVTSTAVRWGDDITLLRGRARASGPTPVLWGVEVRGPESNFGWQNSAVLVVYLLSMVMVGVRFTFRNADTNDYFRGGQSIPWWAAACSIYATMLSSLTFLALPALVYRTDWIILLGSMTILIVAPIAAYVAMPFFRQIDATSAYEYLSRRFNMAVRLFASGLFTLFHVGRIGIVLALTALALAAVTPLDAWQSVLLMGLLSLIYCTLGGIEAVIWTDTIQVIVLLTGALLCFGIIVSGIDGGFAGLLQSGMADNKFRMVNFDFGSSGFVTLSVWVVVLGGIGQGLSSYTADQAIVQRYLTTRDTRAAVKSIWMNASISIPGSLLFFCIGTGLYAFYRNYPEKLDPTIQIDQVFPAFIGTELPVGIAGLIVAGIFAAAQSTVSTSMNSIATTVVTDFMRPFNTRTSERGYLQAARLLTALFGILGTLTGLLFISPQIWSLMEEYFKVIGMFMGALGGLFILGITTQKANGWGALAGIVAGVAVMIAVWVQELANGYVFAAIGILTSLVVGYLASLVLPSDRHSLRGLTLHTMRHP